MTCIASVMIVVIVIVRSVVKLCRLWCGLERRRAPTARYAKPCTRPCIGVGAGQTVMWRLRRDRQRGVLCAEPSLTTSSRRSR
jgi:hypothetical protein